MTLENYIENSMEGDDFTHIEKFSELFDYIDSEKLGKDYENIYDDAVAVAKRLVESKDKSNWSIAEFENSIRDKYYNVEISNKFMRAVIRCIENYNPPVNIPNEPLW